MRFFYFIAVEFIRNIKSKSVHYFICVSNALLVPKHRIEMGNAIWEFLWCLDRMTRIDRNGVGLVLGGKPVNLKDFSVQLGTSDTTTSRNLQRLSKAGYVILTHTPYGIRISIPKAKKRFNRNVNPQNINRFSDSDKGSFNRNVKPSIRNDKPPFIFDKPNKTVSVDNTDDWALKEEDPRIKTIKNEITKLVSTFR